MDLAELKELARRYTEAWNSQDPDRVASFYAEQGALTVNDGEPAAGRRAVAEVARGFMAAFPDMEVTMDDLVVGPHGIKYCWTLSGTNSGPGGTGKRIRISGHELWQMAPDGLIAKSNGHFDAAEYERQLRLGCDE